MRTVRRLTVAALLVFAATASAQQDTLGPVRDLYASAAYEEALTALGRLKAEAPAASIEIDRYRALCLIALGRGSEADNVMEAIVAEDPLYQPSTTDAAPRVRAAFNTVRQRVLPGLARSLYLDAKASYERKGYADAVKALEKTVRVIDSVDAPGKEELADLRMLASGFLDLSRAAASPSPAPATSAAPVETPAPPAAAAALPANTPLVALKQDLPVTPYAITALGHVEYRGIVEVTIDPLGNVSAARIVKSVHAIYDPYLLQAARGWKYESPRIAGKPVGTVKRVEIVLRP